ncbi:MAG: Single-stranded DNA-binding protein [Bacteroides sp.]|uniref:single-stranded DNA-binding protein n=1 Tax=Bacteroides sp. TaxID=29523 RepID=UPI003054B098
MSVNKVILLGHVGKDPEVRALEGGIKVATFSLATTEKGYKMQNGTQVPDRTEWHNIVAWRGIAETIEKYVHKGDKLYLEGKIRTRSYDDNKGVKRYVTEVFVDDMQMLSPKPQQVTPPPAPGFQPQSSAAPQYQQEQSGHNQWGQSQSPSGRTPDVNDLPFPVY